ncbi:MAG: hypothetical protein WCA18_00585 [Candidatus Nanoarchaeia archaeon]
MKSESQMRLAEKEQNGIRYYLACIELKITEPQNKALYKEGQREVRSLKLKDINAKELYFQGRLLNPKFDENVLEKRAWLAMLSENRKIKNLDDIEDIKVGSQFDSIIRLLRRKVVYGGL